MGRSAIYMFSGLTPWVACYLQDSQFLPSPSALDLIQGQILILTSFDCGLVQISFCHHSSQQTGIQQTGEGGKERRGRG